MVENWRTKKISGYVADYQFKDIDNDGENEVVLALVLSVGGSTKGRSVIVSYYSERPIEGIDNRRNTVIVGARLVENKGSQQGKAAPDVISRRPERRWRCSSAG